MLTHIGTRPIETNRLILRPFEHADCDATLLHWAADEQVQKMYGEPVYRTREEVRGLLSEYISQYSRKEYYRWTIDLKGAARSIGQIAFFLVDSRNHFAEIEYCVGTDFQGKGIATEATRAVVTFGLLDVGFHKIQICHNAENPRSKRVIEKCGFTYEGTLRDFFFMDGKYADRLYYSILAGEHEQTASPG